MRYKESWQASEKSLKLFFEVCKKNNIESEKTDQRTDILDHIDLWLTQNGVKISVDFKSQKSHTRKGQKLEDHLVWVEIKNVGGNAGWLYGKADFIVFELSDKFIFVKRMDLVKFIESKVNFSEIHSEKVGLYKIYSRVNFGRHDQIVLIDLNDMFIGKKPFNLNK